MLKKLCLIVFCCAFMNILYGYEVTLPGSSWEVLRSLQISIDNDPSVSEKPWSYTFEFIETRLPKYISSQDEKIRDIEEQLAERDIVVVVLGIFNLCLLLALIWVLKCKKPQLRQ